MVFGCMMCNHPAVKCHPRELLYVHTQIRGRNATNLCIINSNFLFLYNLITTTTAKKKGREYRTFDFYCYFLVREEIFSTLCLQLVRLHYLLVRISNSYGCAVFLFLKGENCIYGLQSSFIFLDKTSRCYKFMVINISGRASSLEQK